MADKQNIFTKTVHGGEGKTQYKSSLVPAITQTSTFTFSSLQDFNDFKDGKRDAFEYGRYGNPTQRVAEEKIADLENAEESLLFSSGMAAICSVLLSMLRSNQHIILTRDCYRHTSQFCATLEKFGIVTTVVAPDDIVGLSAALRPNTRLIFTESPSNPHLHVMDLEQLVGIAKSAGVKLVVDNTLSTPINQKPLDFGVDLVIHSATKYLAGHNDVLAGVVSGNRGIVSAIRDFHYMLGATLDPNSAYLLNRGLKTLGLRLHQQNQTALEIAKLLENDKEVIKVYYPGLKSHASHEVASKQMQGFGGLVSFKINGGIDMVHKFVHGLEIPKIANSLGGVETLVSHPASMAYYDLTDDELTEQGLSRDLVRLSIGIEDSSDLIEDIKNALSKL